MKEREREREREGGGRERGACEFCDRETERIVGMMNAAPSASGVCMCRVCANGAQDMRVNARYVCAR